MSARIFPCICISVTCTFAFVCECCVCGGPFHRHLCSICVHFCACLYVRVFVFSRACAWQFLICTCVCIMYMQLRGSGDGFTVPCRLTERQGTQSWEDNHNVRGCKQYALCVCVLSTGICKCVGDMCWCVTGICGWLYKWVFVSRCSMRCTCGSTLYMHVWLAHGDMRTATWNTCFIRVYFGIGWRATGIFHRQYTDKKDLLRSKAAASAKLLEEYEVRPHYMYVCVRMPRVLNGISASCMCVRMYVWVAMTLIAIYIYLHNVFFATLCSVRVCVYKYVRACVYLPVGCEDPCRPSEIQ